MGIGKTIKDFLTEMNFQVLQLDKKVNSVTRNIEKRIIWQIRKAKKDIIAMFLILTSLFLSILFLTFGLITFFNKFFTLDVVLLSFGVFFALIAFIVKVVK